MKISVFGLGYVGAVTAGCLAHQGHEIIGVDVNREKVDAINSGQSPIVEKDLPEIISGARAVGRLQATTDAGAAIRATELTIVCVGTPSKPNGEIDLTWIDTVSREIGEHLAKKAASHVLVYRSTMLPGTVRGRIVPSLEQASGKLEGVGFHVAHNPEFLRESSSVHDFFHPPFIVVGSNHADTTDRVFGVFEDVEARKIATTIEAAEMVKYVCNSYHALKVAFANEVGQLCRIVGIDSHRVMNIFLQDRKLNISEAYLLPGFAFGGVCLPKDLRAMIHFAKQNDVDLPVFNAMLTSNEMIKKRAIKDILAFGKRRIGFAGISFKSGTDDLRESPLVDVIETLIGKGFDVTLYDQYVCETRLVGANRDYIQRSIPHLARIMVDSLEELRSDREVIVIGNNDQRFRELLQDKGDTIIYDLIRIAGNVPVHVKYHAIAW